MRAEQRVSTVNSLARRLSITRRLASIRICVEAARIAGDLAPRRVERAKPALVDEHARDDVEPFVAGGAGDAGKARQRSPSARIFSTTT